MSLVIPQRVGLAKKGKNKNKTDMPKGGENVNK